MAFPGYEHLLFERRPHGVLLLTMNRPEQSNAMNERMHTEMVDVWRDIARDDETRVVVVTGAGDDFSVGGELGHVEQAVAKPSLEHIEKSLNELSSLVFNIVNLDKPVISAIRGKAVASGLAVALAADISIAAESATLMDGHIRGGMSAGDHAVLLWPLLCSLAKAKYYLLAGLTLDGREAERIGLVSVCLPDEEVLPHALKIAERIATGPKYAARWTKRTFNNLIRQNATSFEASIALELMCLFGEDVPAAMRALQAGRRPVFPSASAAPTARD